MQLEITGTDGTVHYTRPHNHPDVWEALNTPGYSVRGTGEKRASGSLQPDGSAAALKYAQRLATTMWEKHWQAESPNWRPLDDTLGVLTQIDNMVAGMTKKPQNNKLTDAGTKTL